MRSRTARTKSAHYVVLINKSSRRYKEAHIRKLVGAIREQGGYYTLFEPSTGGELEQTVQRLCGSRRWGHTQPAHFQKRGPVSALVVAGGDGTFNIVARESARSAMALGILPLGQHNDIYHSLGGQDSIDEAIKRIVARTYRKIDAGWIGKTAFFSTIGFGFLPELAREMAGGKPPRFGIGWTRLATRVMSGVKLPMVSITLDAFRFEIKPTILQVSLLSRALGLNFSPAALFDDGKAEVIMDFGADRKEIATYLRDLYKNRHAYGADVKLFRGSTIKIHPLKGIDAFVDGDIVTLGDNEIDVKVEEKQIKVFC